MTSAPRWKLFWSAALSINLIAFGMVHAVPKPAVSAGAAFDVAVTVPALYFLLVVRAGLQPLASMITRRVTSIGIAADDCEALERAIRQPVL